MTDKATETPQAAPAVGAQVDRGVRPAEQKQALNDVLTHVKSMPRWALEWEWMAESKHGEFIKRDELIAWLMRELKA